MTRAEIAAYIENRYGAQAEYPWTAYPNFMVFRRGDNRKWFAVVMDIPKRKLGISSDEVIDVINIKCDPLLLGSLRTSPGFYPAYHMNKAHWVTATLDGTIGQNEINWLVDMSYDLAAPKQRASRSAQKTNDA